MSGLVQVGRARLPLSPPQPAPHVAAPPTRAEAHWIRIGERLLADLGTAAYDAWFAHARVEALDGEVVTLSVPTRFQMSWIRRYYRDYLLRLWCSEVAELRRVNIVNRSVSEGARAAAPALSAASVPLEKTNGTADSREVPDSAISPPLPPVRAGSRRVSIDEIIYVTCLHYGVSRLEMISRERSQYVALPRRVAMWAARHLTARSYSEIGREFGGREAATVMHSIRLIDTWIKRDEALADVIQHIKELLRLA